MILRNFVSGTISVMLFLSFMCLYTFHHLSGYDEFFTSGVGYVVSFSCYLLNYLCLTFSYQNHWPMLFPILCSPPWGDIKYAPTRMRLSSTPQLQVLQEPLVNGVPTLTLDAVDALNAKEEIISPREGSNAKKKRTSSVRIMQTHSRSKTGEYSLESALASSHMSSTPRYHTVKASDELRMQRQYEEYLKKQQELASHSLNAVPDDEVNDEIKESGDSQSGSSNLAKQLALRPSKAQEEREAMTPKSPRLSERYDGDDDSGSSTEYDSEGVDSVNMRVGSYDEYRFVSGGYQEDVQ